MHGINLAKDNTFDIDTLWKVVAHRYSNGGWEEESKECYTLFDKKEKGYVDKGSIWATFAQYLSIPISDAEIDEFIKFADSNHK